MPGQLWVCPHCNHLNDKGFLRSTYERRIGDGDTLNSKEYCGSCFESSSSHDVFSGALDASPEAEANPAPARLSFSSEPSPLTMSFSIDAMNTQRRRELPAAQGNDPFPDVAAEPPVSETLLAPVVVTEAGKAPALAELQALTPEEYFCYRCHRPLKIRSDAIISMHCPKCRFEVFVLRALVPPEEEVEALSPEEMEAYFTALPDFLIATRSGKFDEATRAARDMVSLLEESPVLWFNLGVVAALQAIRTGFADEHFPVALSALEQALTLGTSDRPVVLQALHALGTMEFTLKSFIAKVPDVLRQNYRFVDRRDIVKRLQGICDDISLIEKALSPSQRDLISLDPLKTFLLNFLASRPINVPSEVWCPMCTLKVRLDTLD
ncbi:hypothetical protein KJ865_12650, partial [Myxococcota bacterium]|nr:hypothetical protein [Myxococcota bacterium]